MLVIYIFTIFYLLALSNDAAGCIARQCFRPRPGKEKEDEIPKDTIYCQQCYSVLECKKPKSVPCITKYADLTREQFIGQLPFMKTNNLTKGEKRKGKLRCITYSNTSRDHMLGLHMEIRGCFWTENPFLATDNWSGNDYEVGCMLCEVNYCNGLNPMAIYESQYLAQLQDRSLNLIQAPMPLRRLFERPTDKPNQKLYHSRKSKYYVPAPEILKDLTVCYDWFGGGDDKTEKPANNSSKKTDKDKKKGLVDDVSPNHSDDPDKKASNEDGGGDGTSKAGARVENTSNEGGSNDGASKAGARGENTSNEGGSNDGASKSGATEPPWDPRPTAETETGRGEPVKTN